MPEGGALRPDDDTSQALTPVIDVHQHLWPPALVEALRARATPPRLSGWTLDLPGEPPYDVEPAHHDAAVRSAREHDLGTALALVSLSSPLGIEWLPPDEAVPLLDAWHDGAVNLPSPFGAWASTALAELDPTALKALFDRGFLGLQLPADACTEPAAFERLGPLLSVCEEGDRPVLIHPGRAGSPAGVPAWWAAVVEYVGHQHAAWWAWQAAGRSLFPGLRICFAAGAGLAPLHHERFAARAGMPAPRDSGVFLDTSSYGSSALDALIRAVGVDAVVFGTDRPYAERTWSAPEVEPPDGRTLTAHQVAHALTSANPRRLLFGAHR